MEHVYEIYPCNKEKLFKGKIWMLVSENVYSDQTAKALTDMKFTYGKPVLVNSYNDSPVGMQTTILGRSVIINEHIVNLDGTGTAIYFDDLKRALIVGES